MRGPLPADVLRELGGVAGVRQMRSLGVGWRALEPDRLDAGIARTPSGLLYLKDAPWPGVLAREWRGSVACVTAAAAYGLQVWKPAGAIHVATWVGRPRPPWPEAPSAVVHRTRERHPPLVPLDVALVQVLRCLPELEALVVVESAVSRQRAELGMLRRACRGPRADRCLRVLARVDPHAQSLAETLARVALEDAGHSVRSQVPVPGMGRADLEVDGTLLVEIDGRTHHSGWEDFEEDRRRGNAASRARRHLIRIPARWVLRDPQRAVAEVRAWYGV